MKNLLVLEIQQEGIVFYLLNKKKIKVIGKVQQVLLYPFHLQYFY